MAKKLIEVALPLDAINKACAREKSIRHGNPSTLHLWWSRKPLGAARAVIWASLVDDPSSHPEEFPTQEEQNAERKRLFRILEDLVKWENTNNPRVLERAKAEILKSTGESAPPLLDPFAGGGTIPLEAQRLGLEAHAHDLNPVAVMINKAQIEIPPEFADQPPIHPGEAMLDAKTGWKGAGGLAEDVRYYGEWMREEAFRRIGHLYPKVKDEDGQERTVIAWLWTRTVKCPNPACGCEMPLASSFVVSSRKGNEAHVVPQYDASDKAIHYEVHFGNEDVPVAGKAARGRFRCIICGEPVPSDHVKSEAAQGRMGSQLMAIVAEGPKGRMYLSPLVEHLNASIVERPVDGPLQSLAEDPRHMPGHGLDTFDSLFTDRQLVALTTFSDLIAEARDKAIADGASEAYAQAVAVYLAFAVDKIADFGSSLTSWTPSREQITHTFARAAIPMVWDYTEVNPFSGSSGSFGNMLDWVIKSLSSLPTNPPGEASQWDAQSDCGLRNVMVSTDPPYYDNIGYADLSDFFYVWLRRNLSDEYPEVFQTMLAPKTEELVVAPYRHSGNRANAKEFFENGMVEACRRIHDCTSDEVPVTIFYAYKQKENKEGKIASTGWETMLSAIIRASFTITGTWPMRTERSARTNALGTNALASSIVLVCRKRPEDAPPCTRRNFMNALKRELRPALDNLRMSNIAPVDMAQSAIGPGMSIYSRYSEVIGADGKPLSVREALEIINQELDAYFNDQDSDLDAESRFCVELYTQYGFDSAPFGEADVLIRAKNTSVDRLRNDGLIAAQKGSARLLTRNELTDEVDPDKGLWRLAQQMTRGMERNGIEGAAQVAAVSTLDAERARDLAYRLYSIADRKGRASDALAYNSLVVEWPNVRERADKIADSSRGGQQLSVY